MVFRLTGDDTQIYLTKDRKDDTEKKPVNRIPDSLGKGPLPQSGAPSLTEGVSAPPKPFTEETRLG